VVRLNPRLPPNKQKTTNNTFFSVNLLHTRIWLLENYLQLSLTISQNVTAHILIEFYFVLMVHTNLSFPDFPVTVLVQLHITNIDSISESNMVSTYPLKMDSFDGVTSFF
jgi:hypothetical protein